MVRTSELIYFKRQELHKSKAPILLYGRSNFMTPLGPEVCQTLTSAYLLFIAQPGDNNPTRVLGVYRFGNAPATSWLSDVGMEHTPLTIPYHLAHCQIYHLQVRALGDMTRSAIGLHRYKGRTNMAQKSLSHQLKILHLFFIHHAYRLLFLRHISPRCNNDVGCDIPKVEPARRPELP